MLTRLEVPTPHVQDARRVVRLARASVGRPLESNEHRRFLGALRELDYTLRAATRAETRRAAEEDVSADWEPAAGDDDDDDDDDDVMIVDPPPQASNAAPFNMIPVQSGSLFIGGATQLVDVNPSRLAFRVEDLPPGTGPVFRLVLYGYVFLLLSCGACVDCLI